MREAVNRFEEIIGVRPEQLVKSAGVFGSAGSVDKVHLDWTIEKAKSNLALAILDLIKVCFKDLRPPDYKKDTYNQAELLVSPLF